MKAELGFAIFTIIKQKNKDLIREGNKKLTQSKIGKMLGIEQSETSKLINGQYYRFSIERLLYFFDRLNYNVDIKLSPARGEQAHQRVVTENFLPKIL